MNRMRPLISRASTASTSTLPNLIRFYASSSSSNPHLVQPSDSRTDTLRQLLYPLDSTTPTSSSPTGAYHPQYKERLKKVIGNKESHETIERAWKLYQRELRERRKEELEVRLKSMREACDELDRITTAPESSIGTKGGEIGHGEGEVYSRYLYDRAMAKSTFQPTEEVESGKKKQGPGSRWRESRIEGLIPREAWVPTETRGKGWNYDWKRPGQ